PGPERRGPAKPGRERAAASSARRTRRASEGPILPPAPRTATSPSRPRANATSASAGRASRSSSSSSSRTASGQRGRLLTPRHHADGLEGRPQSYAEDPPGREALDVGDLSGTQVGGRPVVGLAFDEPVVDLGEPVTVTREELGMVEGVVQQGRELQVETVPGEDVLVE